MKLSELARLIEFAVNAQHPWPDILNMTGEYYQPYYYLMYLLAGQITEGCIVELGVSKGYGVNSFAYGNPDIEIIGVDAAWHLVEQGIGGIVIAMIYGKGS